MHDSERCPVCAEAVRTAEGACVTCGWPLDVAVGDEHEAAVIRRRILEIAGKWEETEGRSTPRPTSSSGVPIGAELL
ncbi:hypothetical protein [Microbispora rosea]|uniref:hypothetical protein n=1 Tax=Microbispora rosea TaxID=58117 RepID=UPI00344522C5